MSAVEVGVGVGVGLGVVVVVVVGSVYVVHSCLRGGAGELAV